MDTKNTNGQKDVSPRFNESPVLQAKGRVLALADELETESAPAALSAGLRAEMNDILLMVDELRRVAKRDGDVAVSAAPKRPVDTPSSGRKTVSRSGRTSRKGGTKFYRTRTELIKIGKVGSAKPYRHVVPLTVVMGVAETIDSRVGANGFVDFCFDDLMGWSDHVYKSYQVRIVIKWLLSEDILRLRSRGRYCSEGNLRGRVTDAVDSIESEVIEKRPHRKKTSGKRRSGTARS